MNTKQLDIRHIKAIGGDMGRIDVFFHPESGGISLLASTPGDKRRSEIRAQTSLPALRELLSELEREELLAKQAREPVAHKDGVTFKVMNYSLLVPSDVIDRIRRAINSELGNDAVLKEVRASFPMLSDAAASELTHRIYVLVRPRA